MNNFLSSNLKYIRLQKGMTQEQFAKLLNKDYSTIGKWENGTRSPITEDALKIAEILNISLNDLLTKDLRIRNENNNDRLRQVLINKSKELSDDNVQFVIDIMDKINNKIDEQDNNK